MVSLQYIKRNQDFSSTGQVSVSWFLSVYHRETKRVVSLAISVRTTIFTYVYAILVREIRISLVMVIYWIYLRYSERNNY